MSAPIKLARTGLRGALEIRRRAGASNSDPICIYDFVERLGVEVKFFGGSSFSGMYAKASKTILVPALRPPGRKAFTCAHELAHWYFGHGNRIEDLSFLELGYNPQPEEQLANLFASYLLMPPWAVGEAFIRRNWQTATCSSFQAYVVAVQLGVGYGTLVEHLQFSLGLITSPHAKKLLKTTPKHLRESLLAGDNASHLVIADQEWTKVPIDLQVGDMAILPESVRLEGKTVEIVGRHELGLLVAGRVPGITRAECYDGSWATYIRVSRKNFEGRSIYRHLEDPNVN